MKIGIKSVYRLEYISFYLDAQQLLERTNIKKDPSSIERCANVVQI